MIQGIFLLTEGAVGNEGTQLRGNCAPRPWDNLRPPVDRAGSAKEPVSYPAGPKTANKGMVRP